MHEIPYSKRSLLVQMKKCEIQELAKCPWKEISTQLQGSHHMRADALLDSHWNMRLPAHNRIILPRFCGATIGKDVQSLLISRLERGTVIRFDQFVPVSMTRFKHIKTRLLIPSPEFEIMDNLI